VQVKIVRGGTGVELDLRTIGHRERSSWSRILTYRDEKARAWERFEARGDGTGFDEVAGCDPAHVVKIAMGEVAGDLGLEALPPVALSVFSEIPVGSGFGSSAAVAVAVVAACLRLLGAEADIERVSRLALEVERRQHGHPSGADHSAVLHGGVLRVERGTPAVDVPIADWVGRDFSLYDTGPPAEPTGDVVAAVRRRRESDGERFSRILDTMRETVEASQGLVGVAAPETAEICRNIGDFQRCLERIGVVPPEVKDAVRRLEGAGAAAKVSGAGSLSGSSAGCLLVYRPPDRAVDVDRLLAGYRPVEGSLGADGLRFEETA
jgi:mevalonate kinase